jgi:hypothetical protein
MDVLRRAAPMPVAVVVAPFAAEEHERVAGGPVVVRGLTTVFLVAGIRRRLPVAGRRIRVAGLGVISAGRGWWRLAIAAVGRNNAAAQRCDQSG